jgi:two-component system, NtrC family, nitrogen regulation response regulator GlnG
VRRPSNEAPQRPEKPSGHGKHVAEATAVATQLLQKEAVSAPTMQLKLVVVSGPDFGKELALGERTYRVGKREDVDLRLSDSTVSRSHLHVKLLNTGVVRFEDNQSMNGSFCRGMRFQAIEVSPGTVVRIGRTDIQVSAASEPTPLRPSDRTSFGNLCGESLVMRQVFALLERAAAGDADVLMQGETGTGKDLAAEAVHAAGRRADKPFIVCDLAAIAPTLIESELFGHVRGAFTGAVSERSGAFERADGGTIFLDEVGDLPLELQPRLLRVLERRQLKRMGGDRYDSIDVRVVAATHKDLEKEVEAGRFREDLYHRLAVVTVALPPLRDRLDDIPVLVDMILKRLGVPAKRDVFLTTETQLLLRVYDWPGNVRELRNVIERAVKLDTHPHIPTNKPSEAAEHARSGAATADLPFKEAKERLVAAFERDYIKDLMSRCDSNVSMAAREAGIARVYLHRLLQKHGLG